MPIIYSEIEIDVKCDVCNKDLACEINDRKVVIEPCEKCSKDKDDEIDGLHEDINELLDQIDELKRNSK